MGVPRKSTAVPSRLYLGPYTVSIGTFMTAPQTRTSSASAAPARAGRRGSKPASLGWHIPTTTFPIGPPSMMTGSIFT